MKDIEEWGSPERLGLRRRLADPELAAAGVGVVVLTLGVGMWALGLMTWSGDLEFLAVFSSSPGRLGASLCVTSGAALLWVSRAAFWNSL